jgi:hypothetical protein
MMELHVHALNNKSINYMVQVFQWIASMVEIIPHLDAIKWSIQWVNAKEYNIYFANGTQIGSYAPHVKKYLCTVNLIDHCRQVIHIGIYKQT